MAITSSLATTKSKSITTRSQTNPPTFSTIHSSSPPTLLAEPMPPLQTAKRDLLPTTTRKHRRNPAFATRPLLARRSSHDSLSTNSSTTTTSTSTSSKRAAFSSPPPPPQTQEKHLPVDVYPPSSDALMAAAAAAAAAASAAHPYDLCSICWRGEEDRPEAAFEDWVLCDVCAGWYHAVCLHTPFTELAKLSKFRCPTCVVEKGYECTTEHYGKGVQTFVKSINERMRIIYRVYKDLRQIHVSDYSQALLQQVVSKPHPEHTPPILCKPTFSQCFMPGYLVNLEPSHNSPKRKRRN